MVIDGLNDGDGNLARMSDVTNFIINYTIIYI